LKYIVAIVKTKFYTRLFDLPKNIINLHRGQRSCTYTKTRPKPNFKHMKTFFGKPLSKKQMQAIKGGKNPGCAGIGQAALGYVDGCCVNLYPSPFLCEPK